MSRQLSWKWIFLAIPVIYLLWFGLSLPPTQAGGRAKSAGYDQCPAAVHYYYDQRRGWLKYNDMMNLDGFTDMKAEYGDSPAGLNVQHPPPPQLETVRVTATATVTKEAVTTVISTVVSTAAGKAVASFVPPKFAHFAPPEDTADRRSDTTDTFANYKGRDTCGFGSLDLHLPFSPKCKNRDELLEAMSSGGRAGYDEPFIPHGCDMSWYSTEQTCDILNRFSQIFILGDSLQRHLANALYIVLRGDMEFGGITDWDRDNVMSGTENDLGGVADPQECKCHPQFSRRACSEAVIRNSDYLWNNASQTVKCSRDKLGTNIQYHRLLQWPLPKEELDHLTSQIPKTKPSKPIAFIVHTSMWNNVNTTESTWYIEQVRDHIAKDVPWLGAPGAYFPKLYVTANAGGLTKAFGLIVSQGNQALGNFEKYLENSSKNAGYEFLGMYNMSIQSVQPDGTHASYEVNMVKLMMVLNWLDKLDVDKF